MTKRITCDCCGKDLTGQAHLSVSTHNAHPDSWGDPIEADFCNIYQCMRDWMTAQSAKYGWAKYPSVAAPLPGNVVNPYDADSR